MKNLLLTTFCCILFTSSIFSQDFDSAVGLRIGYPLSITYKKFISESNAIEAYAGTRSFFGARYFSVNGAFQIHKDIEDVERLQYYYGGGASFVNWSVDFGDGATSIGLQGYLGLSYTLDSTPINVSIDWIPTFFINGLAGYGNGFNGSYGTIAVRYVLGSNNDDQ